MLLKVDVPRLLFVPNSFLTKCLNSPPPAPSPGSAPGTCSVRSALTALTGSPPAAPGVSGAVYARQVRGFTAPGARRSCRIPAGRLSPASAVAFCCLTDLPSCLLRFTLEGLSEKGRTGYCALSTLPGKLGHTPGRLKRE